MDLQGAGNEFAAIAVQSSDGSSPINGSVEIVDSAAALTVAITQKVTGDISVENQNGTLDSTGNLYATGWISLTSKGDLTQAEQTTLSAGGNVFLTSTDGAMAVGGDISSSSGSITLQSAEYMQTQGKLAAADGNVALTSTDGAMSIYGDVSSSRSDGSSSGGDITLQSKGNMQTKSKLDAANDVEITSTAGDVSIDGDVSTGTRVPGEIDVEKAEQEGYANSLLVHAGGSIREAAGVSIATPVVSTYSGKGVSMESEKNNFAVFLADALPGSEAIDGSVKASTNYDREQYADFTVGIGADVKGDAVFANLNPSGDLGILILHPTDENKEIEILGGNGAKGSLALTAGQDIRLLGDSKAAHDVVIDSTDGSFYGIGRGIKAGNDVIISVADTVEYLGASLTAGNDIDIQVNKPGIEASGIYIGALPEGSQATVSADTSLIAGHDARFKVQGDGGILLEGTVLAETGDVAANVSGEGIILITRSVVSESESVSMHTGEGHIVIGTDNTPDEQTVKAKKDVTAETGLGTITIR